MSAEGVDRSVAHRINERARSRAHRDLIEWYPEEYEELRAEFLDHFRQELGYRDGRVHKGVDPQVAKTVHSRARSHAVRALIKRYRLDFILLRDAHRRELRAEVGYVDGRSDPNRRTRWDQVPKKPRRRWAL